MQETIDYTYKFRLYPTEAQEIKLAKHFGCVRWCYNYFLDNRVKFYLNAKEKELKKKSLNYNDDAKLLTKIKKEFKWLNEPSGQSLQHALKHLDGGFNRFYKKLGGFPKFKKRYSKQSIRFPQYVKVELDKLYVVKFSEGIKVNLHRPIEGQIRNATITKNKAGQYYVSISVQKHMPKLPALSKKVGIDLGIKSLAVLSDGKTFPNIKPYRTLEKRRRILAKALSRTKKDGKGREKARLKLAKLDNYISNVRNNHLHQISRKIINENQVIVMEDLNISGMLKNRKLSKSIWDCSLSELVRQITYKANWCGRKLVQISRWFPSTKTCGNCNYINNNLTLGDREWTCFRCSVRHDRDLNAANNILKQGLNLKNKTVGITGLADCPGVRLS